MTIPNEELCLSTLEVMLEQDSLCVIKWNKEDVRTVLKDAGKDASDEEIENFINEFDWKYFQEKLTQEGFEMLNSKLQH